MADERKVFPVETVLELVVGRKNADVREISSFILGKPIGDSVSVKALAPFAAAWLARWYPRFMDIEWKEDQSWESFVKQASANLGDHISITPMTGRLKALATEVQDELADASVSVSRQTDAAVKLEKKVRELEPMQGRAEAAQKKCDQLEETIRAMKTDLGVLQRKVAEFQGKMPVDHDELLASIKDAIKDGLKGVAIGTTVAGTVEAAASSETAAAESSVPDDFGFGTSGPDADGFGF